MKKQYILPALFMMLVSITSHAQNGTRLIGFDAVTAGRGGTSTGFFDNPTLMMNNPAGLSFLKSSQAEVSLSFMVPTVHFSNALNNTNGKDNLFPLGCISFAKKHSDKITYGFGIFTQGGMGADFSLNHATYTDAYGNYIKQPYHSKFAVMQGGGSLAYKLSRSVAIGITADLVYGQVEFQMPMAMPASMMQGVIVGKGMTYGALFAAAPSAGGLGYTEVVASADMRKLSSLGFNGKIGIAYKPTDQFSFGINYSLPINLTYKNGTATMDMSAQMNNAMGRVMAGIMQQYPEISQQQAQQMAMNMFTGMGIDLSKGVADSYDATAKFGLPQSVAAGLFVAPIKKLRLAVDAEWINWAKAFKQMDISLTNGTNTNISKMMGTNGSIAMAFPMLWKNTVVIRTGLEYDIVKDLVLRGGYVYGSNPVPSSTVFPVFPAVVKHHVTMGASYKMSKSIVVNAAYEHAFRNDQVADAKSYVASEYNNSISSLENNIFHVSLSWIMK